MKQYDDNELRELLLNYEVCEPSPELVTKTKSLMREEMAKLSTAPSRQAEWVLMLVGLSIMMSLCIFYMFTVGTILKFTLPSYLTEFLRHSLFAFTAAGGSILAGLLMLFFLKQFHIQQEKRIGQLS